MRNREQQKPTFKKVIETEIDFKTAVFIPKSVQVNGVFYADKKAAQQDEEMKAAKEREKDNFDNAVKVWQEMPNGKDKEIKRAELLELRNNLTQQPSSENDKMTPFNIQIDIDSQEFKEFITTKVLEQFKADK